MTVVVVGNRIEGIGRSSALRAPVRAQVPDGAGKFLILGLLDMHVHLGGYDSGKKAFAQLFASGIVGIRDTASPVVPPMEALQSATRNPAEFLGTGRTKGTVEVGKLADLVLLSRTPWRRNSAPVAP